MIRSRESRRTGCVRPSWRPRDGPELHRRRDPPVPGGVRLPRRRPAAPLCFRTEPNLTQLIRKQERLVDRDEARVQLDDRIRRIFKGKGIDTVCFPARAGRGAGRRRRRQALSRRHGLRGGHLVGCRDDRPDLVRRSTNAPAAIESFRLRRNHVAFLVADKLRVASMRPPRSVDWRWPTCTAGRDAAISAASAAETAGGAQTLRAGAGDRDPERLPAPVYPSRAGLEDGLPLPMRRSRSLRRRRSRARARRR